MPSFAVIDPEITNHQSTDVPQQEEAVLPPTEKKSPFYRTRKGIIIIVVLVIIIVAAVVGGAVGGTLANRSKHSNQNPLTGFGFSTTSSTTNSDVTQVASVPTGGEQGFGPQSTSTSPPFLLPTIPPTS